MAVRELNGSDDDIVRAIGALSGMTYGTVVAYVKPVAVDRYNTILNLVTSGGTDRASVAFNDSDPDWWLEWFNDNGDESEESNFADFTNDWWVVAWRKGSGNAVARMSVRDSDLWTHDDLDFLSNTIGEWLSPGAGGLASFSSIQENDSHFSGRVAAIAVWSNSLPWSADASGDSAIQAAGLETSAANWLAESPDAMWLFNQDAVTTDVEDVTGNGADQLSRTGTSVVTGDDPPGFDFALDEVVTADISHGVALGHSLQAESTVTADISHGVALGHSMAVDVGMDVLTDITHGIALGHQMQATVLHPVAADISHGIALGHRAEVAIGGQPAAELVKLRHRILTDDGLVGAP